MQSLSESVFQQWGFSHSINQLHCCSNYSDWLPIRVIMLIWADQKCHVQPSDHAPHSSKGNMASVIEIADIWLSAGIPSSDHSLWLHEITGSGEERLKIAFSQQEWKRGRRGELMEIFCNYALFFVQNIDHIGFCYRASLCLGMMARLNETIDNLHNSSYGDINGVYETMEGGRLHCWR